MKSVGTLGLIQQAIDGNEDATNALFAVIIKEHMPARIEKKKGRNVLIDDHEIESDFLLGCMKALRKTKMGLGNPLLYILWQGDMAVAQLFRARVQERITANCTSCGGARRVTMKRGRPTCRLCGSEDVSTHMIEKNLVTKNVDVNSAVSAAQMDAVWNLATHNIRIEEIRKLLTGRTLELFDILVVEEINRDSSQNYVKEIAERWGVSTAAVASSLRRLRSILEIYLRGDA